MAYFNVIRTYVTGESLSEHSNNERAAGNPAQTRTGELMVQVQRLLYLLIRCVVLEQVSYFYTGISTSSRIYIKL
jgi:hypothetical protein